VNCNFTHCIISASSVVCNIDQLHLDVAEIMTRDIGKYNLPQHSIMFICYFPPLYYHPAQKIFLRPSSTRFAVENDSVVNLHSLPIQNNADKHTPPYLGESVERQ